MPDTLQRTSPPRAAAAPAAARRPPLRARLRGRAGERAAMLGIWALAAVAIALAIRGIAQWYVMTDELSYLKQSVFIAHHWRLPMAGDPYYNSHSDLLPLLGAPFLALGSTVAALKLFHVLAAILMASTAVPVFLLARRVVGRPGLAALAAALAVSVPWVAMSVTFMSEPVAYPVAAWALLAIHEACVRPGARSDGLALLAIALACFARAQLVVLAGILVACVVVHELVCGRGGVRARAAGLLRGHRLLAAAAGLGLIGAVVVLAVPAAADAVLGNYDATTHGGGGGLLPDGMWVQVRFLVATHIVALAVLPFAFGLAFALAAIGARREPAVQAAATLVLVGGTLLVLQAGWFTKRYGSYDDRYLLYLAPLLIVGFVAALERPWRLRFAAIPAALATWFAIGGVALTSSPLYLNSISTANHAAIAKWVGKVTDAPPTKVLALGGIAALALAVALGGTRRRRAVPWLVGAPFLVVSVAMVGNVFQTIRTDWRASSAGRAAQLAAREWVDDAVGSRAQVAALLGLRAARGQDVQGESAALWWDTSFWNEAVDHAYAVLPGGEDLMQNYATRLRIDPADGRLENLRERYALLPAGFLGFALRSAATVGTRRDLRLLRLPARPRLDWRLTGYGLSGQIPAAGRAPATLTLYPTGTARSCRLTLTAGAAPEATRPVRLRRRGAAGSGRMLVRPGRGAATMRARVRVAADAPARVRLSSVPVGGESASARLRALAIRCGSAQAIPSRPS